MKRVILSAMVIILVAGSADAQSNRYRKQRGQHKFENRQSMMQPQKAQLYNQLNMSSKQRVNADRLNQDLISRIQSLQSNNRMTQQQKRSAANGMIQQHQYGFKSLLSPTQSRDYSTLLGSGALGQASTGTSGLSSLLGDYGWILGLLGGNQNLGSLLGNLDIGSLLGLFIK